MSNRQSLPDTTSLQIPARRPAETERIDALQGMRGLGMFLVLFEHTVGGGHRIRFDLFQWWTPGVFGLRYFFVLSGFLITGILFRAATIQPDRGAVLKVFYIRRCLRILPVATLAMLVAYVFDVSNVRERIWWYLTYTINIRNAAVNEFDGGLGHFWSLALEEQFYLFWPFLVLFVPRRLLGRTLVAMIAVGVVSRLAVLLDGHVIAAYVLMPTRLDALAAGGLLALALEAGRRPPRWLWAGGLGMAVFGGLLPPGAWANHWMETGMVIVSVMLVDGLRHMQRSWLHSVMTHPAMVYIGGISYGMYVWHQLLPLWIRSIEQKSGVSMHLPWEFGWKRFVYISVGSFVLAALSWHLMEGPLNALKRYFPYAPRRQRQEPIAGPSLEQPV